MNLQTKPELSDSRCLDLIWVYAELFPLWTDAQKLEHIRGLLAQTDRGANFLVSMPHDGSDE